MGERKPAREWYDVVIDIGAEPGLSGCYAGAIVKLAYRLQHGGRCDRAPAVPLENDLRDPGLQPRIPPHSDFWPRKRFVDVGVIGKAIAPGGRPVPHMRAAVAVGEWRKDVEVFGDRVVEWTSEGRPRIGEPQPFTEMPLDHLHAYGGVDKRVPVANDDPQIQSVEIGADHPGLYPRNPWGKGYLAVDERIDGVQLPNLEDPRDRLTDARVIARPRDWYLQPLPWYLDWTPVNCFPRNLFLTIECDPWFPPPDDRRLKEVHYGLLPGGYHAALNDQHLGVRPAWQFHQEASHGLVLPAPPYGAMLSLEGMHPGYPVLQCNLPAQPPTVDFWVEGQVERVAPELTTIAVYPDQELLTLTFAARKHLPRPFVPGIHKHIPVAVYVDGDAPVPYQAPPTTKEKIQAAQAEKASQEAEKK